MPNVETKHPDPQFAKFYEYTFLPNMPTFLSTSKPKFYPAEVIILYT